MGEKKREEEEGDLGCIVGLTVVVRVGSVRGGVREVRERERFSGIGMDGVQLLRDLNNNSRRGGRELVLHLKVWEGV